MDPVIEELVGRRALAAEQATGASVEFSQRTLWQRLRGASPWRVVDRYGCQRRLKSEEVSTGEN